MHGHGGCLRWSALHRGQPLPSAAPVSAQLLAVSASSIVHPGPELFSQAALCIPPRGKHGGCLWGAAIAVHVLVWCPATLSPTRRPPPFRPLHPAGRGAGVQAQRGIRGLRGWVRPACRPAGAPAAAKWGSPSAGGRGLGPRGPHHGAPPLHVPRSRCTHGLATLPPPPVPCNRQRWPRAEHGGRPRRHLHRYPGHRCIRLPRPGSRGAQPAVSAAQPGSLKPPPRRLAWAGLPNRAAAALVAACSRCLMLPAGIALHPPRRPHPLSPPRPALPSGELEAGQQYTWSSRGPAPCGDVGVNFSGGCAGGGGHLHSTVERQSFRPCPILFPPSLSKRQPPARP